MKKIRLGTTVRIVAVILFLCTTGCSISPGADDRLCKAELDSGAEAMLMHSVYFTLKDDSETARCLLIDDCYKYLEEHPGIVFFSAGALAEEMNRPVNDRDFDVGLHILFKSRKYHDDYQVSEKHQQLVKKYMDKCSRIRVFDSLVK